MAHPDSDLDQLLDTYPQTFAEQAGIRLADTPAPLFQLLLMTSLLSANLDARLGLRATSALVDAGMTTARHLADASDHERWQVLSDAKYLRKKQTASQLGDLARHAIEAWDGDLRTLRNAADGDVAAMGDSLQEFSGIGAVGADIFLREVQAVWPDLRPYADDRILDIARQRGLPHTARGLADRAGTDDLSHVGAALVQAERDARHDAD